MIIVIRRAAAVSVLVLCLLIFSGYSHAANLLPWVRFNGTYQVTAGIGAGALTLNASVSEMDYENGEVWRSNVPGVESVHGAKVVISGAIRTGDYSFNGDPADPDDVGLSIVSQDGFVYFSANLADSTFVQSGTMFVWLNQFLNAGDPATLNLNNITLHTDAAHPSRYINELAAYLSASNTSGMKMQLRVPTNGTFASNATGAITFGLIDGLQSLNTPPVANAGPDITIPTSQVASTALQGLVTDADDAAVLTCSWTDESGNVLRDWTPVGIDGLCPLDLSATQFSIGTHTLALLADDGIVTTSDTVVLTIHSSLPQANAGTDRTITSEEVAATVIQGAATDFDNTDQLYCKWTEGATLLLDRTPAGPNGACPLGGLTLGRGTHILTLEATDGQAASSDDMVLTINNTPPTANAGENITVTSDQAAVTTLQGSAADFDGDPLTCRWKEGEVLLQDWTPAEPGGQCVLSLNSHSFSLGEHTLTLEANDGQTSSSNSMKLTVNNSAPHAAPGGAGVYQINTPVILPGDVSDFDGDLLQYRWTDETAHELCSGDVLSAAGGASVLLPDCIVYDLGLGMHAISLQVSDGVNAPVSKSVMVQIIDTAAPTLQPVANRYLLWPPNHKMVDIAIQANASDNSGCAVTLNASVASNEPQTGLNRGDQGPDWTEPVIDQTTGIIYLQLRAERSGRGNGRKYTVTITAADCAGNISAAKVKIRVPKDQDCDERRGEDREERDRDDRRDGNQGSDRDD